MARITRKNKSTKASPAVGLFFRSFFLIILSIAALSCLLFLSLNVLKQSKAFVVKDIIMDPSVAFLKTHEINKLKGKNIFDINLKAVQHKLQLQYPEISQLKVCRRFPDKIFILAKIRNPIAQINVRNRIVTLDEGGFVLADYVPAGKVPPLIKGAKIDPDAVNPGFPLRGKDIAAAINIIKAFAQNRSLTQLPIVRVEVDNLSQINVYLSNTFKVIIDQERFNQEINVLEFLLTQGKIKIEQLSYIDLRFKEPIVKMKEKNNAR